ncbi:50S ribosomal protein L9 [Candidatus Wolfebacteria bacterium]|nr:50S ribosomal protein L9 [Candidatus Wolfebacteria bacterium]
MKVILTQKIPGLGNKYDIKNVSDGYARNFLIPRGLAKIATEQSIKELETKRASYEKEEAEIKNKLEALAGDLAGREFNFAVKTGKKGEVFGSVSKDDIKSRIHADIDADLRGFIDEGDIEINLERPIKTLGEQEVDVDLSRGAKTKIKVLISAE